MDRYSDGYFGQFAGGSKQSAEVVLPLVNAVWPATSVADFGCGLGAWLAVWHGLGIHDVVGCDGPYVKADSLLFDRRRFIPTDLTRPVRLGRRFDLVQSLEVAEHLPASAAPTFVETLVAHAPAVLFSAASPGQGGEFHVNEQPLEYWRSLFRGHGYVLVDALRPKLVGERRVEPWYRYNVTLFVQESELAGLRQWATTHVVAADVAAREFAPFLVRVRHRLLRHVPERVMTPLASGIRRALARSSNQ